MKLATLKEGITFDAARGEMLRRKIGEASLSTFASESIHMVMGLTFNKSQEDEADEYGFRLLVKKGYDPFAMSSAFDKLAKYSSHGQNHTDLVADFFMTHPHTELRLEKFLSRAKLWKANHPEQKWYIGKKNFANQITYFEEIYSDEWDSP